MGFRDIINQERAKEFLKSSITSNRVANGYLFHGPRGVGKSTTALAFAQALNCENNDVEGCGECTSCRKIARFSHPDVTFIFPTSSKDEYEETAKALKDRSENPLYVHAFPQHASIKIGTIQGLRMSLASGVREGRRRVIILAFAEKMTPEASNCLLRMLEEPPAGVTFVLTATSRHRLFSTIVSRCQAVPFVPLAAQELERVLVEKEFKVPVKTGVEEARRVTPADARIIARLSEGSLSAALDLMPPESAKLDSEEENIVKYRNETVACLRKIGTGEPALILAMAEELAADRDRDRVRRFVRLALLWMRDLLLVKHGAREDDIANRDMMRVLKKEADAIEMGQLRERIDILDGIVPSMERNVDLSLLLSASFLRLAGLVKDSPEPLGTEVQLDGR
jgi:DNA polymerase-3 subunit delta'